MSVRYWAFSPETQPSVPPPHAKNRGYSRCLELPGTWYSLVGGMMVYAQERLPLPGCSFEKGPIGHIYKTE